MFYRLQDPKYLDTLTDGNQTSESYVDGSMRAGKSVMRSIEELAEYIANSGVQFDDHWVLVELDGDFSDEQDEDAAHGVELVHPTEIIDVQPFEVFFPYLDEACNAIGL